MSGPDPRGGVRSRPDRSKKQEPLEQRTVTGALRRPACKGLVECSPWIPSSWQGTTDLISNLGAFGAMVFAMVGFVELGTCSVAEEDRRDEDVVRYLEHPSVQDAVDRVVSAEFRPRCGLADRRARIHGLCINLWVGIRRGVTQALAVCVGPGSPAKPVQSLHMRVRLQG